VRRSVAAVVLALVVALLVAVPLLARALDQPFYVTLFGRIMIWAIAALSLNLILGYGGMVSFGHAAYLGVGVYTVGILSAHGIENGYVQWPLAIAASALVGLGSAMLVTTAGRRYVEWLVRLVSRVSDPLVAAALRARPLGLRREIDRRG